MGELRAELAAAQEQCSREQEAAAGLLEANLRLHETVLVLVEQGSISGSGSDLRKQAAEYEEDVEVGGAEEEQRPAGRGLCAVRPAARSGRLQASRPPSGQHLPGARASAQHALAGRPAGQVPGRREDDGRQPKQHQQRPQRAHTALTASALLPSSQAAAGGVACSGAIQQKQEAQRGRSQQPAAARQAAVSAALALSAQHHELFARQKAAIAELQHTAGYLATAAAPSKQLALLRRHAELQNEVRDCSARLEANALQLAALRRSVLL